MRFILAVVAVIGLTGCQTAQQAEIDRDDEKCRSYGLERGSPPYVQCRMSLDQGRAKQRAVAGPFYGALVR